MGAIIDGLLATPGHKFKEKRLETMMKYLRDGLQMVDEEMIKKDWLSSEEFHDILVYAVNSTIESRSIEKIKINSMILGNVITVPNEQGEFRPEEYLRAIADLSSVEMKALMVFYEISELTIKSNEQNELQFAIETKWKDALKNKCGLDDSDVIFIAKRLERTGFLTEIVTTALYCPRIDCA